MLGRVVPTIVDEAKDARMIVLEHRDLSTVRRLVTRSVAGGVAAHARVPVVSVPSSYSPEAAARTQSAPPVVVGVDVPEQSAHLLRAAGVEARNRGVPLHVLHTWAFPSAYDDIVMSRTEEHDWEARSTSEIEAVLDSLGSDLDGVQVRIDARHARPADALVEASQVLAAGGRRPARPGDAGGVPRGTGGPGAPARSRPARCCWWTSPRSEVMPTTGCVVGISTSADSGRTLAAPVQG